ncbi:MAG: hypothetical protein JWO29_1112 [Arthrobacter sp.]|nr:hypothetical protein [Arthrobacter sp.]
MGNFRAVIDRGHNQQKSKATNFNLVADDVAARFKGGRAIASLQRTPSLESHSAASGSCAPRSEPAASEPSETEALPPAAAGSLKRSVPLKEAELG